MKSKMLHLIWFGVSALLCGYFIRLYMKWRFTANLINKIPGPKSYPLIGNLLMLLRVSNSKYKRLEFGQYMYNTYGKINRTWIGIVPVVTVKAAEDVGIILSSRVNIEKAMGYTFFERWLGTGLLTSKGAKWQKRRKLLTPAFHFSVLGSFLPVIVENCQVLIDMLETVKTEFNVFPFISKCTLDIICETAMGVKLNIQKNEASEYFKSIVIMNEIIAYRSVRPWLWNPYLYSFTSTYKKEINAIRILHNMSSSVIQKRKAEREKCGLTKTENDRVMFRYGEKKRKAFLDLLLDISDESTTDKMSEEDIREEVDTFMFEGHDTTSSSIALIIYSLATHSDIQEKVAEELFSVFGNCDRTPTLNDIAQLEYLDRVIKESMRLFPPVPIIGRTLTENVTLSGGQYVVPAGTLIQINFHAIHRIPDYFPDPEKFNPDHFLPEKCQERHPFTYLPFSAGPRNCIGQKFAMMEEKVIISSLLRKYEIKSVQTEQELNLVPESILRPDGGVRIQIMHRVWKA